MAGLKVTRDGPESRPLRAGAARPRPASNSGGGGRVGWFVGCWICWPRRPALEDNNPKAGSRVAPEAPCPDRLLGGVRSVQRSAPVEGPPVVGRFPLGPKPPFRAAAVRRARRFDELVSGVRSAAGTQPSSAGGGPPFDRFVRKPVSTNPRTFRGVLIVGEPAVARQHQTGDWALTKRDRTGRCGQARPRREPEGHLKRRGGLKRRGNRVARAVGVAAVGRSMPAAPAPGRFVGRRETLTASAGYIDRGATRC